MKLEIKYMKEKLESIVDLVNTEVGSYFRKSNIQNRFRNRFITLY